MARGGLSDDTGHMHTEPTPDSLPDALLQATAYPHATGQIRMLQTHMSWVYLTGRDVYKVKKPVRFPFADFSSPAQRRFFCEEELRLNRRFAPDIYLGVCPVVRGEDGSLAIGDAGRQDEAEEWAVHMRQFDPDQQADVLLDANQLSMSAMHQFGQTLATQYAPLPPFHGAYDPIGPMQENIDTLRSTASATPFHDLLDTLQLDLDQQLIQLSERLLARADQGLVRECHGDLHLSNLVQLPAGITAFDCLEFSENLRMIDLCCDTAFLLMDCMVRERGDLGYAFIDGYLDSSGDYAGATLLPLFARYRSLVRAKVAALQADQSNDTGSIDKLHRHLQWAVTHAQRPTGRLIIMHGVSGTGKSYWAKQLAPAMGAIRLRSDVLRKVSHGLDARTAVRTGVGEDLYQSATSATVYTQLGDLAGELLRRGEHVIVDAACLQRAQRETLYGAARQVGAQSTLLHLSAPESTLRQRIETRNATGNDPSDADGEVLSWQLKNAQSPEPDEPAIIIDTTSTTLDDVLNALQ